MWPYLQVLVPLCAVGLAGALCIGVVENGRKALFLNPVRMESIVGMEDKEALALIDELIRHATQKKYEYRHKWRHGDWVLWDNRSGMHQANPDYDMRERRYLYRLLLKGETPG